MRHATSYTPPLDFAGLLGIFDLPELDRRSPRLCVAQQHENSGFSCLRLIASLMVGYKLAGQRPDVREAQAAYLVPGSVVPSFFVFNPQKLEAQS